MIEKGVEVTTAEGEKALNCFSISADYFYWTFCAQDLGEIFEFRENVKKISIMNYADKYSLQTPDFIIDNSGGGDSGDWTWSEQEAWPSECQKGRYQSPISFTTASVKKEQAQAIKFEYMSADNVVASSDGKETELTGSFGSVTYSSNDGEITYTADRVVFKFPQEHFIDEEIHTGEL